MTIAIVDYSAGNLHSALKAVEHVADGATVKIVSSAQELKQATRIILPGVGAFADCMAGLQAVDGLVDELHEQVLHRKLPFLGICVGMQMLFTQGREHGTHKGLGWIDGDVDAIRPASPALKIPHMGWNDLTLLQPHPLLAGINTGDHAYFVHSYHAKAVEKGALVATVDYGETITAIVAKDNICGTQFHPEKSQKTGLTLLRNFLSL